MEWPGKGTRDAWKEKGRDQTHLSLIAPSSQFTARHRRRKSADPGLP